MSEVYSCRYLYTDLRPACAARLQDCRSLMSWSKALQWEASGSSATLLSHLYFGGFLLGSKSSSSDFRSSLTVWTTSWEKIWRGWRRSGLTVVSGTSGGKRSEHVCHNMKSLHRFFTTDHQTVSETCQLNLWDATDFKIYQFCCQICNCVVSGGDSVQRASVRSQVLRVNSPVAV